MIILLLWKKWPYNLLKNNSISYWCEDNKGIGMEIRGWLDSFWRKVNMKENYSSHMYP